MAKKVVLEVEDYAKVLSFVSEQKISTPGAVEAFGILNAATLMDIRVLSADTPNPPLQAQFTEEDFADIPAANIMAAK